MFHEFQRPAGITEEEAFTTSFEQIDAAERWGLDAMWLAEIHVAPERSVCSAPLTLAAAIAARTKRMKDRHRRAGPAALPSAAPRRGSGDGRSDQPWAAHFRGWAAAGFRVPTKPTALPTAKSRERFTETLEILKRAWTEPKFSYHGKYYSFDNVALTPKPYQKPWPEIRIAANSADTFPAIAKLGPRGVRRRPPRHDRGTGTEHRRLPQGMEGSRASRRGSGVFARPSLCRRDR